MSIEANVVQVIYNDWLPFLAATNGASRGGNEEKQQKDTHRCSGADQA